MPSLFKLHEYPLEELPFLSQVYALVKIHYPLFCVLLVDMTFPSIFSSVGIFASQTKRCDDIHQVFELEQWKEKPVIGKRKKCCTALYT